MLKLRRSTNSYFQIAVTSAVSRHSGWAHQKVPPLGIPGAEQLQGGWIKRAGLRTISFTTGRSQLTYRIHSGPRLSASMVLPHQRTPQSQTMGASFLPCQQRPTSTKWSTSPSISRRALKSALLTKPDVRPCFLKKFSGIRNDNRKLTGVLPLKTSRSFGRSFQCHPSQFILHIIHTTERCSIKKINLDWLSFCLIVLVQ